MIVFLKYIFFVGGWGRTSTYFIHLIINVYEIFQISVVDPGLVQCVPWSSCSGSACGDSPVLPVGRLLAYKCTTAHAAAEATCSC